MKKKNVTIWIVFILTTVIIAGGVFWYWNNLQQHDNESMMSYHEYLEQYGERIELPEVDTTGWETYRDEEFGFEFMYPGDEYVVCTSEKLQENFQEHGNGSWQEKTEPAWWSNESVKGKIGNLGSVRLLEREGVNEIDIVRCHYDTSAVTIDLGAPIWGDETAEEMLIRYYMKQESLSWSLRLVYVQINGIYMSVNKSHSRFLAHTLDGIKISVNSVPVGFDKNPDYRKMNEKNKFLSQSVIQTFKLIE